MNIYESSTVQRHIHIQTDHRTGVQVHLRRQRTARLLRNLQLHLRKFEHLKSFSCTNLSLKSLLSLISLT